MAAAVCYARITASALNFSQRTSQPAAGLRKALLESRASRVRLLRLITSCLGLSLFIAPRGAEDAAEQMGRSQLLPLVSRRRVITAEQQDRIEVTADAVGTAWV